MVPDQQTTFTADPLLSDPKDQQHLLLRKDLTGPWLWTDRWVWKCAVRPGRPGGRGAYLQGHLVELGHGEDGPLHHVHVLVPQEHVEVRDQFQQQLDVSLAGREGERANQVRLWAGERNLGSMRKRKSGSASQEVGMEGGEGRECTSRLPASTSGR